MTTPSETNDFEKVLQGMDDQLRESAPQHPALESCFAERPPARSAGADQDHEGP
mgnify:CR=1 FL=1